MEYASKGVAGAALGTGIAGLSLGVLNSLGGLGSAVGMFGPRTAVVDADTVGRHYACSEDHHVNRYEAAQAARIAELETEVKLRDANTYTDQKILATYQYIDGKLEGINAQICQQNVYNATNNATLNCLAQQVAVLQGLTKTVIPKSSICPEPMDRYTSWTAPTATATT